MGFEGAVLLERGSDDWVSVANTGLKKCGHFSVGLLRAFKRLA